MKSGPQLPKNRFGQPMHKCRICRRSIEYIHVLSENDQPIEPYNIAVHENEYPERAKIEPALFGERTYRRMRVRLEESCKRNPKAKPELVKKHIEQNKKIPGRHLRSLPIHDVDDKNRVVTGMSDCVKEETYRIIQQAKFEASYFTSPAHLLDIEDEFVIARNSMSMAVKKIADTLYRLYQEAKGESLIFIDTDGNEFDEDSGFLVEVMTGSLTLLNLIDTAIANHWVIQFHSMPGNYLDNDIVYSHIGLYAYLQDEDNAKLLALDTQDDGYFDCHKKAFIHYKALNAKRSA